MTALVQAGTVGAAYVASGSVGTLTLSGSGSVTIGNCVTLCIDSPVTGNTVSTVTSPIGTFTLVEQENGLPTADDLEWWICLSATGAGHTVTVTTTGGGHWQACAQEWSGAAASAVGFKNSGATTSPTLGQSVTSGQIVLAAADCAAAPQGTATPSSPWTVSIGSASYYWNWTGSAGFPSGAAYQVAASSGIQTATWTKANANAWVAVGIVVTPVGGTNLGWGAVLNELAGTTNLGELAAANAYAGTNNLGLLAALNVKAGTKNLGLDAVCNSIAGTTGNSALAALNRKAGNANP
jgi:hypothetical protein